MQVLAIDHHNLQLLNTNLDQSKVEARVAGAHVITEVVLAHVVGAGDLNLGGSFDFFVVNSLRAPLRRARTDVAQ